MDRLLRTSAEAIGGLKDSGEEGEKGKGERKRGREREEERKREEREKKKKSIVSHRNPLISFSSLSSPPSSPSLSSR